ncbi:MAG: PAS domain S-box protein [Campylobacterales bacterium]|nr:PAS domain S-box protein [Campylobacterales bacterium]
MKLNKIKNLLISKEVEELRLKYFIYATLFLWSLIVVFVFILNIWQDNQEIKSIAENIARANFLKDQAFRSWASSHGGIYVPSTERTPPNPKLSHVPDRDITKPDGTKLTLMNPAYMVRQMSNEYSGLYGIKSKITSLKYLYDGNKPDEWETEALKSFEQGEKEAYEYTEIDKEPYLRLMRPMYIQESCLKCHAYQGYKVGDVRGGVGVAMPLKELYVVSEKHKVTFALMFISVWLLGVMGIIIFAVREFVYLQNNKIANEELLKSEAKFRALYDNAPDMYVSVSPKDATILLCNETVLKKTGYSKEELIGSPIFKMYDDDCMQEVHNTFEEFVKSGVILDRELILKRKDGTKMDVSLNVDSVRDRDGKILYSMSSWRDITEHKQMESEIKSTQEYLQTIFDATPNLMITTDGIAIKKGNAAMLKFTGYDSLESFKKEHDCICNLFVKKEGYLCSKMGEINWLEYILANQNKIHKACMMKDGNPNHFMVLAQPLNIDTSSYTLVIFNDITELENAMNTLKEKDEIMISQSRHAAMGEMISMIAHQWRQPISAISMGANNILADIELDMIDAETLKTTSLTILSQTQELSKTIDDFRNFFRPVKMAEEVLIEDIFTEAFSVLGKSLENHDIEVKKEFHSLLKIETYSRELMQVFINILKNAKEALVENRAQLREINISTEDGLDIVVINICNNGGTILENIIDKIFNPYFSTKDEKNGTGLGLYMSKTIIEKHLKGTLRVSNIEEGVCFKISLPKTLNRTV